MSHITYDTLWSDAQDLLLENLQIEPTQADSREQRKLLATLYVRYIVIANRLSECVDQMVQPQKRILIKKVLEATVGRILELKHDLVEADLNEYTHIGDALDELHLTPNHVELRIPACFREERQEELSHRRRMIDGILEKLGYLEKPIPKAPITRKEAILLIQTHERARQGRARHQFMKEIRQTKEKSKTDGSQEDKKPLSLQAAMCIQKIWRGYTARRATKKRKLQEMLLIGMIPPQKIGSPDVREAEEREEIRRCMKKERQIDYEQAIADCKEYLEKHQRAIILEQLTDQVRNWIQEYKTSTGKIPEYTAAERSSSRLMMSRQGTGTESNGSKSSLISSKESKGSKKSKTTKQKEQAEEVEETVAKSTVSVFLPELNAKKEEYNEVWRNKDESINFDQYHYRDIIQTEQMILMEEELRKIVDEMMKAELQILQDALDRDRGFKGKRTKKASKKARKGAKKAKKKKEKDLTPDRTTESLYEELVANGIIKKCPEVYFKDIIGEKSFNHPLPYNKGKVNPKVAMGDLRQVMTEFCSIPMLTSQLHESTPHIKSLLIAGPNDNGKDMLVHAVCTESGATFFDLTPSNIVGKYPGKSGLIMMIHLVTKVARLLQPSIIYMDNAERPFVKKIPKTDKTDPKRLKKDLPKIVKNFWPEDRIMLIGCTSCPWESDQKLLQQVYQKYLYIPKPDYASRYALWQHLLGQYSAISWQFDYSGVTKISDGYTMGTIIKCVKDVMTVTRKIQLRIHPLSPLELINALAKMTPIYKEEEEALSQWWMKTPLFKRRQKAVETLLQTEAEMQAKQANAKRK